MFNLLLIQITAQIARLLFRNATERRPEPYRLKRSTVKK